MTLRIEHAHPLTLLRELPARWAQTCVTEPPEHGEQERTLLILSEVHRIMRDDATLWLLGQHNPGLLTPLLERGWIRQQPPACVRTLPGAHGLILLTKQREYFCRCDLFYQHTTPHHHSCVGTSLQARRSQRCIGERGDSRELLKRCVLASTSILACGACGAPYRQTKTGERTRGVRRASCTHNNPQGRCLVLDPFYRPFHGSHVATAQVAHSYERSFLGIIHDQVGESR